MTVGQNHTQQPKRTAQKSGKYAYHVPVLRLHGFVFLWPIPLGNICLTRPRPVPFGRSSILVVTLDFSGSIFVAVIVDFKGCDPRVMRLWPTSRFALTPASAFYILELGSVWRVQVGVGIGCRSSRISGFPFYASLKRGSLPQQS